MPKKKFNPTPGPWVKAYSRKNKKGNLLISGNTEDCRIVCQILGTGKEKEDNAHLIVAAPTMYHKLADTVEGLERAIEEYRDIKLLGQMIKLRGKLKELRDDLIKTLQKIE
ncbi:MAG: hypothetical protein ACYDHZ_00530 [Dehalococcoidia bacterium]